MNIMLVYKINEIYTRLCLYNIIDAKRQTHNYAKNIQKVKWYVYVPIENVYANKRGQKGI